MNSEFRIPALNLTRAALVNRKDSISASFSKPESHFPHLRTCFVNVTLLKANLALHKLRQSPVVTVNDDRV